VLHLSRAQHPFFPYPAGKELCKTSTVSQLGQPHPVLTQDDAGWTCWKDDVAAPYPGPDDIGMGYIGSVDPAPLTILQTHPTVGMVTAVCSFAPAPSVRMAGGGPYSASAYGEAIPIWGNEWAFSWEPFVNFELKSGQREEWSIAYSFGECPRL
jgi:hypothetical protein